MDIRVYGFFLDQDGLPDAMEATSVFEAMGDGKPKSIGKYYTFGVRNLTFGSGSNKEDWWAGIILKVRDSKAFTKLTNKDGKRMITAETLRDDEQLAEINFFIANPANGSGLYAHHYQSASIINFNLICGHVFEGKRREHVNRIQEDQNLDPKQRKAELKRYRGRLKVGILSRPDGFSELVTELKSVNSLEVRFKTVQLTNTMFRGIEAKAKSELVRFTFPPAVSADEIADTISQITGSQDVEEAIAVGRGKDGASHRLYLSENPHVFDTLDYDKWIEDLSLDLDDFSSSIEKSKLVKHLHKISTGKEVRRLLSS